MVDLHDTIVAVATPPGLRTIVRVGGPRARAVVEELTGVPLMQATHHIVEAPIEVDGVRLEARHYVFLAPHSYTGQDVIEIHTYANQAVVGLLLRAFLQQGVRQAGPGEFTALAYLNGKIDLAQAEAVNEIISSTNRIQCAAAEKMLQGRLSTRLDSIRSQILDILSQIEAGLDFGQEDVAPMPVEQTVWRLGSIRQRLESLLSEAFQTESLAGLPSVGIAGSPNAGKSTLFNALIGSSRSLVSDRRKTTRDVLEAVMELRRGRCVLFDCAGLLTQPEDILDQLAQQAALQSLGRSDLVVFCVDLAKSDWRDDLAIRQRVTLDVAICVATKIDLIDPAHLAAHLDGLGRAFGKPFLPISASTDTGLAALRRLIELGIASKVGKSAEAGQEHLMLTAHHRHAVAEAVDHIDQALRAMDGGQEEVAAMMVRAAYQEVADVGQHVDEKVLDAIFSRFCIGK